VLFVPMEGGFPFERVERGRGPLNVRQLCEGPSYWRLACCLCRDSEPLRFSPFFALFVVLRGFDAMLVACAVGPGTPGWQVVSLDVVGLF